MNQTVLLAGSTGMLGGHIARELLTRPDTHVRVLLRPGTLNDAQKRLVVVPFIDSGAEAVEADLSDQVSLDRATAGADVIVSALQGGPDVIIKGQVALAEAGKRNGVHRMLPSDFALDLFKSTPGEHMMFDLRRTADEAIAAMGLKIIHVLNGAFMEMFKPGAGVIDKNGVVSFWGDGNQPIEVTSVADTARMATRVAMDPSVPGGKFAFAGDQLSILDAIKIVEAQTGREFERRSLGSEADLRDALGKAGEDKVNPFNAVMLAYQLYMLTGQTALTDLQNDRYPDLKLETFRAFTARTMSKNAA